MSSLGQILREAREAKGLTQSKVAAETRILVQIIADMENEDFHRIAAPIYGRGFVRMYAECVGLDPQPLIREFMEIYAGRRAPTVRVREVPADAPPPPPPPPPRAVTTEAPAPLQSVPAETRPFAAAEVPQYPSTEMPQYPSTEVPAFASTEVPQSDSTELPAFASTEVPQSDSTELPSFASAEVPQSDSTELPSFVSAEVPPVRNIFAKEETPPELQGFLPQSEPVVPPPAREPFQRQALPPRDDSPFLSSSYREEGPSALDRFRTGLSSVSDGVVGSVRNLPPNMWKKATLVIAALAILALIVFGCIKLYQLTTPAGDAKSSPSAEKQIGGEAKVAEKKPATETKQQPAQPTAKSAAPGKLRSTGQKIPPLYVD